MAEGKTKKGMICMKEKAPKIVVYFRVGRKEQITPQAEQVGKCPENKEKPPAGEAGGKG